MNFSDFKRKKNPYTNANPTPPSESTKKGLPPGFVRHTIIIKKFYLDEMRAVAYWERRPLWDVFNVAYEKYLSQKPDRIKHLPDLDRE